MGRFTAARKGQMELYLRWLAKHETETGEEPPLGLILCAEAGGEGETALKATEPETELRYISRSQPRSPFLPSTYNEPHPKSAIARR